MNYICLKYINLEINLITENFSSNGASDTVVSTFAQNT